MEDAFASLSLTTNAANGSCLEAWRLDPTSASKTPAYPQLVLRRRIGSGKLSIRSEWKPGRYALSVRRSGAPMPFLILASEL